MFSSNERNPIHKKLHCKLMSMLLMTRDECLLSQAFAVVRFLFRYPIPVAVFVLCYGRIFHTIRRQSKVVAGHAGRSQDIPMATTSRDPNTGQVQQQATGATTGHKLSRTEMNVLKTMIAVIVCYMICWSVPALVSLQHLLGVSMYSSFQLIVITSIYLDYCFFGEYHHHLADSNVFLQGVSI